MTWSALTTIFSSLYLRRRAFVCHLPRDEATLRPYRQQAETLVALWQDHSQQELHRADRDLLVELVTMTAYEAAYAAQRPGAPQVRVPPARRREPSWPNN